MSTDPRKITVTSITPTHPQGFGGHEFEYQRGDDVFRCVIEGCGEYEVSVRDSATGEITPCRPVMDEISGGWSTDGWWIGEGAQTSTEPDLVSRCGGPGVCERCAMEQRLLRGASSTHLEGDSHE